MDLDDATNLEDAGSSTTTTPTTLGPLGTDDKAALRRLRYRYSVGDRDIDSPFPLDAAQAESLQEGAFRPASTPEATAVRGATQALIGGSTAARGWGRRVALGPVGEGLAQYLEWHAGSRDRPDLSRLLFETVAPVGFAMESAQTKFPEPEGEYTEAEQHEAEKRARRAFEDLVKSEKRKRGMSTETTWEDVLGQHHRGQDEDPLDLLPAQERKPPKGYSRRDDPRANKNFPYEEPATEAEWEALPDDPDWHPPEAEHTETVEGELVEPRVGGEKPLSEDYIPLPYTPSESEWRTTERMAAFRKGGPFARGARSGAMAVARGAGAGPATTQPGTNPQFLRRVDAELEARMKGENAFSIFAPFTTDELQQMRDVEIR